MGKLLIVMAICCWEISSANATMLFPQYRIPQILSHNPLNFSIDTSPRPYTQFDFGTTRLINNDGQHLPNKMIFSRHVAVGADFTGNRIGLYFTNFGRYKWQVDKNLVDQQVILDINEFGLSYTHAIAIDSILKPYIGARIGYTHFKLRKTYSDIGGGYLAQSGEQNHVSMGTFGGLEATLSPNFTIGIGVEYGRLRGNDTTDLTTKAFTRTYF